MLLVGFAVAGWEGVEITEEVEGDFHAVEVSAACSVQLEAGDTHQVRLRYSAEEGTHPVTATVVEGKLQLLGVGAYRDCVVEGSYQRIDSVHLDRGATARLSRLEGMALTLHTTGASALEVGTVKAKTLAVRAESSSTVTLEGGSALNLAAHADGASSIVMSGVRSESAKVTSTAASAIDLSCAVRIEAKATGSSAITYTGGATDRVVKADVTSTISKN